MSVLYFLFWLVLNTQYFTNNVAYYNVILFLSYFNNLIFYYIVFYFTVVSLLCTLFDFTIYFYYQKIFQINSLMFVLDLLRIGTFCFVLLSKEFQRKSFNYWHYFKRNFICTLAFLIVSIYDSFLKIGLGLKFRYILKVPWKNIWK